jgi:hypothetical protein
MFADDMMLDADQTAVENGEDTFNSVRGDGAANILTLSTVGIAQLAADTYPPLKNLLSPAMHRSAA